MYEADLTDIIRQEMSTKDTTSRPRYNSYSIMLAIISWSRSRDQLVWYKYNNP